MLASQNNNAATQNLNNAGGSVPIPGTVVHEEVVEVRAVKGRAINFPPTPSLCFLKHMICRHGRSHESCALPLHVVTGQCKQQPRICAEFQKDSKGGRSFWGLLWYTSMLLK